MQNRYDKKTVFYSIKPSMKEAREEKHLLIFGDIAQWMVVDDELLFFLSLFNGKRPLKGVIREFSKKFEKPLETAKREAEAVIPELLSKNILRTEKIAKITIPEEKAEVANITINLTNRCNLKCPFCYNSERETDEIDINFLMDKIEEGKEVLSDTASFIILGGEPLLFPERLLTAIDRANSIFTPDVLISTNGTLITDKIVSELHKRRVDIQVSLDSSDQKTHDALRGEGVFEKAISGVKKLAAAGINTTISKVYTSENINDFEPYLDLALELGVNEARFIPLRLIGGGKSDSVHLPDQFEVFTHLRKIVERRPEFRPLLKRDFFSIQLSISRFSSFRAGCGIGRKVLFIDADGKVYPCPNHTGNEFESVSIEEFGLREIFLRSPLFSSLREKYQVKNYSTCKSCPIRYWCAGDCRGEVVSISGDPYAPSPHCSEMQKLTKEMFFMIAENSRIFMIEKEDKEGKKREDLFQ